MANLTSDQVVVVASIQQLINEWANELDVNNGLQIAALVTEDCEYTVRAVARHGRAAVVQFYQDRLKEFAAQSASVPIQRHTLSNLRVDFRAATEVSIAFTLVFYTTAGMPSGTHHADPAAVADVWMDCRRESDGHWRIKKFDSNQVFIRTPPSAGR